MKRRLELASPSPIGVGHHWFGSPEQKISRTLSTTSTTDSGLGTSASFGSPSYDQLIPCASNDMSPLLNTPTGHRVLTQTNAQRGYFDGSAISPMRSFFIMSPLGTASDLSNPFASPKSSEMKRNCAALKLSNPGRATEFRFSGNQVASLGASGLITMGSPETAAFVRTSAGSRSSRCLSLPDTATASMVQPPIQSDHTFLHSYSQPNNTLIETPSKQYPTSTSRDDADLFGGFPMLSTSTPLRDDFNRTEGDAQTYQYLSTVSGVPEQSVMESLGVVPVLPCSPNKELTMAANAMPRTPTPFKKALAAIERKQGRLQRDVLAQDHPHQMAQDLREIITNESVRSRGLSFSQLSDTTMNFNLTPSKTVDYDRFTEFSPPDMIKSLGQAQPRQLNCAQLSVRPPDVSVFKTPSKTPKPLGRKWMQITCGRTKHQLEMTRFARQLLGLPPS